MHTYDTSADTRARLHLTLSSHEHGNWKSACSQMTRISHGSGQTEGSRTLRGQAHPAWPWKCGCLLRAQSCEISMQAGCRLTSGSHVHSCAWQDQARAGSGHQAGAMLTSAVQAASSRLLSQAHEAATASSLPGCACQIRSLEAWQGMAGTHHGACLLQDAALQLVTGRGPTQAHRDSGGAVLAPWLVDQVPAHSQHGRHQTLRLFEHDQQAMKCSMCSTGLEPYIDSSSTR